MNLSLESKIIHNKAVGALHKLNGKKFLNIWSNSQEDIFGEFTNYSLTTTKKQSCVSFVAAPILALAQICAMKLFRDEQL